MHMIQVMYIKNDKYDSAVEEGFVNYGSSEKTSSNIYFWSHLILKGTDGLQIANACITLLSASLTILF